jgi:hypothetical protein
VAVLTVTDGVGVGVEDVIGGADEVGVDDDGAAETELGVPLPVVLVLHPARVRAAAIRAMVVPRAGVMNAHSTNSCRSGWIWSLL